MLRKPLILLEKNMHEKRRYTGRPAIQTAHKLTERAQVYFSPEQMQLIHKARGGMPLPKFIRDCVMERSLSNQSPVDTIVKDTQSASKTNPIAQG